MGSSWAAFALHCHIRKLRQELGQRIIQLELTFVNKEKRIEYSEGFVNRTNIKN
jgi:hypothetical protein